MGMASPGGLSAGTVTGRVEMDISQLIAAANHAKQLGVAFERALNGVNAPAQRAQTSINSLGRDIANLAGIASGVALARQFAQFAVQADATATAYRRQSVAALDLAGSQSKLTALIETYNQATGNQIGQAQALADVTQLQAIGFADTTAELNEFVVAARGSSLALGKSQEYIIGQLQLAIANQSKMRLDQLGLGVGEVDERIQSLKAANSSLSTEMAYQNAVLGLLTEKYGKLAGSLEAQATGAENAARAWADLRLQFGLDFGPAVGGVMEYVAKLLDEARQSISGIARDLEYLKSLLPDMGFDAPQSAAAPRYRTLEEGALSGQISRRQSQADFLRSNIAGLRSSGGSATEIARQEAQLKAVNQELGQFGARLALVSGAVARTAGANNFAQGFAQFAARPATATGPAYTPDQTDLIRQWATDVQAIEREAGMARVSATRQYEQQRSEAIADYGRTVVREEQDFARNRLRAVQDYAAAVADAQADAAKREADAIEEQSKAIARVRRDAGRRDADWTADYNERIVELRADSNERLIELDANYARERERAELGHRDRLLSAAANLDAAGVFAEKRAYARQQQEAEENHDEQRGKLGKALQEQLDDALAAHQERLADARAADRERLQDMQQAFEEQREAGRQADRERLADMQEAFDQQLAREDEDRAIQNARRDEDHAAQLAQMATAQAERMAQLDAQAANEKKALDEKFTAELSAAGLHNENWKKIQDLRQAESLRSFDLWWQEINKKFAMQGPLPESQAPATGWVTDFVGGRSRLVESAGGGSNRSVTVAAGAIVINASAGQNEVEIGVEVRRQLEMILEEAGE
jgi:hypothetical protein